MTPNDLSRLDATDQAALVTRGEITAEELVSAACERLERLGPALGALSTFWRAGPEAIAASLNSEGPFRGVPFLMKDVGARQIGQPYHAGNRALRALDHRADADTLLGARFRELGFITLGNSRAPEFGLQSNTWPLVQGPTRNPWNLQRSAGGSSGGACAAVAAGLVPVAHASDGAGSIRIPASWCGLIGLKPSRDRIAWRHSGRQRADVEFVVARSLRDTAILLDLLRPARERARHAAPYRTALDAPSRSLRIGFCTRSFGGRPVAPECIDAVQSTLARLEALGHRIEDAAPETFSEYEERSLHAAVLGFVEYRECLRDLGARLGRRVDPEDVEPFLWELAHVEFDAPASADIEHSTRWLRGWEERTRAWFDSFDLLVTPTVCEVAPNLDELDPRRHAPLELLDAMVPHMAFTETWNATGQPAISLPLAWREADGLPIGVQLVAPSGRDDRLISMAASLLPTQATLPRVPPIHA